jgi:hypothetical protein
MPVKGRRFNVSKWGYCKKLIELFINKPPLRNIRKSSAIP